MCPLGALPTGSRYQRSARHEPRNKNNHTYAQPRPSWPQTTATGLCTARGLSRRERLRRAAGRVPSPARAAPGRGPQPGPQSDDRASNLRMPCQQATFRRLEGYTAWGCGGPPSKENGLPRLAIYRREDMTGTPTTPGPSRGTSKRDFWVLYIPFASSRDSAWAILRGG